jgi:hypothetical protein
MNCAVRSEWRASTSVLASYDGPAFQATDAEFVTGVNSAVSAAQAKNGVSMENALAAETEVCSAVILAFCFSA